MTKVVLDRSAVPRKEILSVETKPNAKDYLCVEEIGRGEHFCFGGGNTCIPIWD